ncbi:MAG: endolytic transglycosylase MltG [Hyphomicrobiaceae bacterium]
MKAPERNQHARPEPKLPPPGRPAGMTPRSPSEMLVPTRPPRPPKRLVAEREPRRMNGFLRFVDGSLSFVFLSFLLVAALAIWLRQSFDAPGPLSEPASVVIAKGEGAIEIAERLEKSGIVADRRIFTLQYYVARLYSGATGGNGNVEKASLKAGEYQFHKAASVRQVLDTIISGRGILQKVTIPEGLTSRQIIDRLKAEPGLAGEIVELPAEGSLLPDTYKFSRGTSRQEIVSRMQAEHAKLAAALWAGRDPALPLQTIEEALVLASIVEKETGRAEERPRVAAVFVNRLRKGMRLQSDPTIVYGLVGGQGPLGRPITRADIDSKTPYNTYQIDGLPPGPICNPGRAALAATLNPPSTTDLYFVADGTGGHTFTSTLKDHNAAVQSWRKIERSRQQGTGAAEAETDPAPTPSAEASAAAPAQPKAKGAKSPSLINASKAASDTPPARKKASSKQQQN